MNPFQFLIKKKEPNQEALMNWILRYTKHDLKQFAKIRFLKDPVKWSELPR